MGRCKAFLPLPTLLFLSACSPVYVFKMWRGHSRLLAHQRPIQEMLKDPDVAPELRARLELVEDIRAFAFDTMGLARSKSYTGFVAVPGPSVTVTVSAAKKTALEAYQWWFPILGKVPYKGFFDRKDALKEKARLEKRGYDTYVSGVKAYSTLGWSRDPVLSTMLEGPDAELAEVLLHELAHGTIFFKNSIDFNEALATFVGEEGSAEFIRRRFGENSIQWREAQELREQDLKFTQRMDALYDELEALYSSPLPEQEKLNRREAVFDRAARELNFETSGSTAAVKLNNAVVLAHRRYHYDLEDFRSAYARMQGDWPKILALWGSLDKKHPRESLRKWLSSGS